MSTCIVRDMFLCKFRFMKGSCQIAFLSLVSKENFFKTFIGFLKANKIFYLIRHLILKKPVNM